MKLSKIAVAAMLGLGLTAGLASTASARLSDYTSVMSEDDLNITIQQTERTTGLKIADVATWSRDNIADYNRFWQTFAYNFSECVTSGRCSQSWDAFGQGGDGAGDSGGDSGGGDGGGGGGGGGR